MNTVGLTILSHVFSQKQTVILFSTTLTIINCLIGIVILRYSEIFFAPLPEELEEKKTEEKDILQVQYFDIEAQTIQKLNSSNELPVEPLKESQSVKYIDGLKSEDFLDSESRQYKRKPKQRTESDDEFNETMRCSVNKMVSFTFIRTIIIFTFILFKIIYFI